MDTTKQINKSIIVSILTNHCGETIDLGLIMNMMVEMEFGGNPELE